MNEDLGLKTVEAKKEPTQGEERPRARTHGVSKGLKRKERSKIREEVN